MSQAIIKQKDIIEDEIFTSTIKDAKELDVILKDISTFLKSDLSKQKISIVTPKSIDDAEKMEDAIKKNKDAIVKLNTVEKEREKLKERLRQLEDGELDNNIKLKAQISSITALKSKEYKESLKKLTAYEKEDKRLKELRKSYKALIFEQGGVTAESEKMLKEIQKLDEALKDVDESTGEYGRSVGNYEKALSGAIFQNLKFTGSFGDLSNIVNAFKEVLIATKEETENTINSFESADSGVKKFSLGVKAAGTALKSAGIGVIIAGISTISSSFNDTITGAKTFAKVSQNLLNSFKFIGAYLIDFLTPTFTKFGNEIKIMGLKMKESFSFGDDAKKLRKEIYDLENGQSKYNKQIEDFKKRDFKKELVGISDQTNRLIDAQFALRDATQKANIEMAKRRSNEQLLIAIADDDTRGFIERSAAREEYNEIARDGILETEKELEIAKKTRDSLKSQLELSKIINANGEESLSIRQELTDAEISLIDAQTNAKVKQVEVNQKLNKELFDEIEQIVDFLIDGNEQVKVSNEKIINSDLINLEKRKSILLETQKLIKDSNIKVQNEIARSVKGLNGDQIREAFKNSGDDVIKLNESLTLLGLAEIPINRLLELFKESKAQARDFADSIEILNKSEKDFLELQQEIDAQNKFLSGDIKNAEEYSERLLQIRIGSLENQLKITEKGSVEEARLNKELNDILLKQLQERLDKEKEAKDKEAEALKERQQSYIDYMNGKEEVEKTSFISREQAEEALTNFIQKQSEKRLESINKEIDAQNKQIEDLRNLANFRSESAQENLAIENKNLAKLEREKAKKEREAKQIEFLLTVLKAYSQNLDSLKEGENSSSALFKTLSDISILKALPSFDVGADRLSNDGQNIDGKGGFLAINHPDEKILKAEHNRRINFMPNEELVTIAEKYQNGVLVENGSSVTDIEPIVNGLNELKGELRKLDFEKIVNFDNITDTVTEITRKSNNIKSVTRKIRIK